MKTHKSKLKVLIIVVTITSCLSFLNSVRDVSASPERYDSNYDDEQAEIRRLINDNTYADMENLAVTFSMGAGTCLIRGVRYKYNNVGIGPYDVEIRFVGDSAWVSNFDTNIPHVTSDSWRTLRNIGNTYLLDDDPEVHFIGTDPSDDCISLCADNPSNGYSYYDVGSGWVLDAQYEYIVELIYETVEVLPIHETITSIINSTDNIDAYFISLENGIDYKFMLQRTSGVGNLNMRVVTYQDLTNDVLAQSSGSSDYESLLYTSLSTGIHVLLVEAQTAGVDMASYSIQYCNPPLYGWTWVSGNETAGQHGVYGTKGVPDIANYPGGRSGSVSWIDKDENLWLFGGGNMNDLWRFNLTSMEWTWMSGNITGSQYDVYGTKGVPDIANYPGGREDSVSWIDTDGNLWLFGGWGYAESETWP